MMHIKFGVDGYVEGYVIIGGMPGAIEFGGTIPDGFDAETCRCYRLVGGELVLDDEKLAAMRRRETLAQELVEVYAWLDMYHAKLKEFEICQRIGEPFDGDMAALDAEAAVKAARKKEILAALEGGSYV